MTTILAIETSTEACSAALWIDDTLHSRYAFAPQAHAKLILPMCESLLVEADILTHKLSAIAFGCGPGSFTGNRIAAAVTQGIALAHDLPVIPISSLQALAQTAYDKYAQTHILAAIDARMGEVYWGEFQVRAGLTQLRHTEIVCAMANLPIPSSTQSYLGAGSGWQTHALTQHFMQRLIQVEAKVYPTAHAVAKLAAVAYTRGAYTAAAQALPVYLRDNIVR